MALVWTQALAVGVEEIDEQHRELFRRVDRLLEAASGGLGEVGPLIAFLREYVARHFASEERYMDEQAYPGRAAHQAEHRRFADDLAALESELESNGPGGDVSARLHRQVGDWLRGHILVTDLALGRFVRRARRPEPG